MDLKMIINPLSNKEKKDIWTTLAILKEKSLLESYQRQFLFKAAKYDRWYIGVVPKFVETFIEIINLQDKEKIDKLVNFKDILTKINKEFIEKVKSDGFPVVKTDSLDMETYIRKIATKESGQ